MSPRYTHDLTPGDWRFDGDDCIWSDDEVIAEVIFGTQGDGHCMAASKQMLEALKSEVRHLENIRVVLRGNLNIETQRELAKACSRVRSAIAAARPQNG